ncbi:MAG: beta-galactosidase [Verrucomicrobiota bacterium]
MNAKLPLILAFLCLCAAGGRAAAQVPQGNSSNPGSNQVADAVLPAGVTLDWDKTNITAVNAKRVQISLGGVWRFMPAAGGAAAPAQVGWAYIRVPGSWAGGGGGRRGGGGGGGGGGRGAGASALLARGSGSLWTNFNAAQLSRAWYERQVRIPAEWQGRAISLRLERVSTDAIIYVNGKECGRVSWPWGSVDITSAVTPGQTADVRVLVAAIADSEQVGHFMENAFMDVTYSAATLATRGLTGNVYLESCSSEGHVTDVFVRTSTRKKDVALDVELTGVKQAGQAQFVAEMLDGKGAVEKSFTADAAVEAKPVQTVTVSWPWADPRLWDEAQPNLYTLRLTVKGAGLDDEYDQEFGFREFWVEGRQFYLNGTVIHLRQHGSGPPMNVGDDFAEFGPTSGEDARGSLSDIGSRLEQNDQLGYFAAVYILNADKYIRDSSGNFIWDQNKQRALDRAEVWIRHYRNHPSAIMWIAGFNFFNSAMDADPHYIGRDGWGQDDQNWWRDMVAGREMFDGLKKLDPTRAYYSHAGAFAGDVYSMNLYLDLLPLQEREDWLSQWAKDGEMPITMTEFGTPLDATFRRGHDNFHSGEISEPLLTEYVAIYFGTDAYAAEEPAYRQFLHNLFRGEMLYGSSQDKLDIYADMHKIQQLYRVNTWRSWRTAGLGGGLRTWGNMQDALQEINGPTLAWIAGQPEAYTAKDHHFSPGQKIQKQIVLINDMRQPQDFTATWTASVGGKEVGKGEEHGRLAVSEIKFIPFQITAPAVEAGGKTDGQITLASTIGPTKQQDTFAFRVFGGEPAGGGEIAVVDPDGMTTKMLANLGYTTRAWNGGAAPLVVIGRNALKDNPALAAKLEPYVQAGGRVLISGQDPDWMIQALGWRVCPKVARRVFPMGSPVSNGLDADDLRDWTGSSTLIEAYPVYTGDYFRGDEREQPYAGWHWGNGGGVSSAAIEKPHRSGWRPLLECEFDLAYTPLMELDYGQGRLTVCTLDLEDHMVADPAARRMAGRVIDYALHSPLSPQVSKAVYLGGDTGAAWLDKIGVSYARSATLDTGAGLLLIGPDATVDTAALNAYLEQGGKAFFLPRAQADGWLGVTLQPAATNFAGSLSAPDWPEARGLSASDLRWRSYLDTPPWVLSAGAEIGADGLIGRKTVGKGEAIFCQVDPDAFNADQKTYFRYTRWRSTRAVAQLLADLGASFAVDSRIFHPLDTWELNLNGEWQMKPTLKLPVPASEAAAPADPGVTPAAHEAVGQSVSAEGWTSVTLPQALPYFQGNSGEAVFRKEIVIPESEAGKDLNLSLGVLAEFDNTYFNGVEVGHTDMKTADWRDAARNYVVPGNLVKAGSNVIAVRLFVQLSPAGFAGNLGYPVAPDGDRSGRKYTGPKIGLEMSLKPKPEGSQALAYYHPDYRTDFSMGDNPYRYYRW